MPLKKILQKATTPLIPELDIQNPVGSFAYDVLREFTSPAEIAATLALLNPVTASAAGLSKINKIRQLITSRPARAAAKTYISGDMLSNIPFSDLGGPRTAGVDYLKAGVFGGLAGLPWALDRPAKRVVEKLTPSKVDDIPDVPDENILDLAELRQDSEKFNKVMQARDPNIRIKYADGRKLGVEPYLRQLASYRNKSEDIMRGLSDDVTDIPIEQLDLDKFEFRRGNYVDDPLEKQTLELARNKLYRGPGAAGRQPTGEDAWKVFLADGTLPQGANLTRAFGYIRDLGLFKGHEGKKFAPEQMQDILKTVVDKEGLKKKLRRLERTSVTDQNRLKITRDVPFEQATRQFASHYRVAKALGGRALAKQATNEMRDYLVRTGLAERPDVQRVMKNIQDVRMSSLTRWATNLGQLTKGLRLVGGVPGTALNYHGIGIVMRTLFDKNSPTINTVMNVLNPKRAQRKLKQLGDDTIIDFQRLGLNLQTERDVRLHQGLESVIGSSWSDVIPGVKEGGLADKFTELHDTYFGKPLFERVLPMLKINTFTSLRDDLVKQGFDFQSATHEATKVVNSRYGGIDQRALVWKDAKGQYRSRSRELDNKLRAGLLASDWAETNRRYFMSLVPKPMLKVVNKMLPDTKQFDLLSDTERKILFRQAAKTVVSVYGAMTFTQKATTGTYIHQNPPGKRWHYKTPIKDEKGKDVYVPIALGTSMDYARIPAELIQSTAFEGDVPDLMEVARNRLSQPARLGLNIAKNTDFANRPLIGPDQYNRPQSLSRQFSNVGKELLDTIIPQYADAAVGGLSGEYSLPQVMSQALEVPVQFHRPYNPNRRRPR